MKPRQIGEAPLVRIVSVDDRLEEMRQQLEEMTRDESLDVIEVGRQRRAGLVSDSAMCADKEPEV